MREKRVKGDFCLSQSAQQRIVSLLPSATEILFALGLGEQVLGITHACDYPPEVLDREVLVQSAFDPATMTAAEIDETVSRIVREGGSTYIVNAEAVQTIRPELIITQTLCEVCAVSSDHVAEMVQLLDYRPDVLSLHPHTLEDVLEDIRKVGEATGTETQAQQLIETSRRRINAVRERAATVNERPKVFCFEWYEPPYVGGHWVPQMVEYAGGESLLSAAGQPSVRVEWEKVVASEPDVLVLMPCGYDLEQTLAEATVVTSYPGWHDLPAVKNGRVFAVSGTDYFNRPGPRLVDGLEMLAWILHPHLFEQPDLPAAVARLT